MLTIPTLSEAASVALVGVLRTQLLASTPILRLIPAPALLGEDLDGLANCVFLLDHLNQAEGAVSFVFRYS